MPFEIGTALVTAGMSAATQAAAASFAVGVDVAIAAAAGTATTAYGTYASGQQQKANMAYNAKIAEQQARREELAAGYEAGLIAEKGRRLKATQRTLYAKAGLTGAGTPLLVLQDTATKIRQDILMTGWVGQQRAGYYRSQAGLSLMQGRSAAKAGLIGAGSSLLSGGSDVFYRYKQMKP